MKFLQKKNKKYNHIDIQVGNRINKQRRALGITQKQLGKLLGVTFQQIQKYEKGINRISASSLLEIARLLEVPLSFFFQKEGEQDKAEFPVKEAQKFILRESEDADARKMKDTIKLIKLFEKIESEKFRKEIIRLTETLLKSEK
ncbi:helix-turn-helix domain-containing protein [Bartonella sp. DGB1]|uniref:helix-turn-helix domain-containing protein n=1 Tax=Bartonella sp. DGB1 TaxID=3239807 RepID=UPI0035257A7E